MAETIDLAQDLQSKLQLPQGTPPVGLEAYIPQQETGGFFKDLSSAAINEVRSGLADLPRVLNKVTDALNNAAIRQGVNPVRTDIFARLAEAVEPQDFQNPDTLAAKFGQVFGGLLIGLPKYGIPLALTGLTGGAAALAAIPVIGGIEAATAWGQGAPPGDIAKAGLAGAVTGGLFAGAGRLPRKAGMALLGGGAAGVQALAGETRPEELAITGLTMAGMRAIGPRLPHNLSNQLHKLGYSNEAIKSIASIKRAREVVRNKEKYTPPEPVAATTIPTLDQLNLPLQEKRAIEVPGTTVGETTGQLGLPLQIRTIIDPETLIYNKILTSRGFTDKDIGAMSIEVKIAITNDPAHNSKTVKIDPISGAMTLTDIVKEPVIEQPVTKGGATVEDLAADPVKTAAIVEHLKTKLLPGRVDVEKLMEPFQGITTDEIKTKFRETGLDPGTLDRDAMIDILTKKATVKTVTELTKPAKIEEIEKNIAISEAKVSILEEKIGKPKVDMTKPLDKTLVSQLRFKFQVGIAEAKKTAKLLQERGITIPTQATTFFETINLPLLPKGKSLATHVLEAEVKAKQVGPIKPVKAQASVKREEAKNLWLDYKKEKDTTKRKEIKTKIAELLGDKTLIAKDIETYLTVDKKGITPDDLNIKLDWIKAELEKLPPKEIISEVKPSVPEKAVSRKKTTAKQLEEIMKAPEETNITSPEHAALIDKAEKLWPRRRLDLATLSDEDLKKIVDKNITPQKATLTPTGKLLIFTAEDKTLATILGASPEEAAPIKENIKPTSPGFTPAEVRSAALWMEIDPDSSIFQKLTKADMQQMVDSHKKYIAEHIGEITKLGETIDKGETKAAQTFNKTISQDPMSDPELTKLNSRLARVDKKIEELKPLVAIGNVDRLDLNTIQNERNKVIREIAQRRHNIANEKKRAGVKLGGEEKLATLIKDDNGGIVVKTNISDKIDKFQFITTEDGKTPLPGDTNLKVVAEVIITDKHLNKPVRSILPETLSIPQSEFFKEQFSKTIETYYANQGKGISDGIKLRSGIDIDLLKEMGQRLRAKTVAIYQTFAARKGANKSISRENVSSAMKDIMDADTLKLKEREITAMHAEQMEQELGRISKITKTNEIKQVETQAKITQAVAQTDPNAAAAIAKGEVPMVKPTDILGQSMANANPDIVKLQELTIKTEMVKRYLKEKLVYGEDSRLNKIFAKINAQPNAKALREALGNEFIAETKGYSKARINASNNPLIIEAKQEIVKFLDTFGDMHDLRERGFFINKYFPLIADMENTYKKIRGMWSNIENNRPYNKDTNSKGIPDRYIVAGKSMLEDAEFNEIKSIIRKDSWNNLSSYEKNRIRYDVLQHEGIYDEWAFLPSDVQERTSKKTFNQHLQARTGGDILLFKYDAQEVLRQYIYTMINKEADALMKHEAAPIMNAYPRGDIPRSVRWYMERQVKQALGTRTVGARWLSQETERLNGLIGKDVINPNFPTWMAGKISGQVARGALGPDTAIRNIMQSVQTLVNEGPGAFAKGLHSMITDKEFKGFFKKGSTEDRRMFDILLGAEEYYEGEPVAKTLKGRWGKAEGSLAKTGAFYNWVADMALTPMRATEHFNKFLAFQSALSEAGEKGLSFEKGVRLGLLRAMEGVPDLVIPDAYWNAFKHTIQSQYGYSKVMRNPLTRGPLAKISTIFWSYPANTVQFIARGLTDGLKSGDIAKTTRFALYMGFQLTIATALAQLGLDVGSIFGVGLMPVKLFSVPWDLMKGTYNMTFGQTEQDRSKGSDDVINAAGILSVPQFRYGKKVLKTFTDLERGYKVAGKRELEVMETSPLIAMMDLMGMPFVGPRHVYDLTQQMRDQADEYQKEKQDLVLKGIKALDKGSMEDVRKMFQSAKDHNVVITYSELYKYHRIHKTKTYLESQIERLPKHLRAPMQKRVDELNQFLMPNKFGKIETIAERSMWSAAPQTESESE